MHKDSVKNFAVNARRKLIDSVSQKAYGLGISIDEIKEVEQIPNGSRIKINNDYVYLTDIETEHRERLIEQIEYKGYEQVVEEVAYTWFNRIIAIRFMEVNEYLPTRIRVLSSEDKNKVEPDAVTQALDLVEDLGLDREKIYNYQDNNDTEGLFKYIFIKQCNALGKIMPVMFEKIQDYTELLLPDNLLVEGSVIRDLIINIEEDDFKDQVEIIGWLYQYYISEKKDEVFAGLKKNKKITKENIPAATQLFTPDWIVKYMVENSLGRLWLEGHPDEELKSSWKYYLEEAEQEPDVEKELDKIREESKKLSPEDITLLDPDMGSGHILVYAFDVLYQIYLSAGYSEREIPRLILEKNLYGLDIDDRAGQLAYFALIMKARSYSRRFFRDIEKNPIELNVCAIQESNGISEEDIEYFADGDEELKRDVEYLVEVFNDAKEYGSILEIEKINIFDIKYKLNVLKKKDINLLNNDFIRKINFKLSYLVKQYELLYNKYYVCITNPPYMGNKGMNSVLSKYLNENYPLTKSDLYSVFIEKGFKFIKNSGFNSMVTMHSWMFLNAFENYRNYLISNYSLYSLVHLGMEAFENIIGKLVQTVAFVFRNQSIPNIKPTSVRLVDFYDSKKYEKECQFFNLDNRFERLKQNELSLIPGKTFAYWISESFLCLFKKGILLKNICQLKTGLVAGNNEKYFRNWYEVDYNNIELNCKSLDNTVENYKRWYPINHGGNRKKWYGNHIEIVDFKNNAQNIMTQKNSMLRNKDYYFKKGINWNRVGSSVNFAARISLNGFIFDDVSPSCFIEDKVLYNLILAYMNTKVFNNILNIINTGFKTEIGHLGKVPMIDINNEDTKNKICKIVNENIQLSKLDWDKSEISWDYKFLNLLNYKCKSIQTLVENLIKNEKCIFNKLKINEQRINEIFEDMLNINDKYILQDNDITISIRDRNMIVKDFISYAVGCMMGRYSLDEEGLVFAGGEFDINRYKTFKADKDAIIPITDMEYFEDDIVSRFVEFVKVVFGEETLEENLNYIADTECFKRKANETSRDCLRRYFLKGFMEDHLKVYQKRPIYWMFDSGKQNGFKALIYMHRYDENMVAKVRADYLHVLQRKYESEINRLDNDINSEILSTKEKTVAKKRKEKIQKQLAECKQYDQVIAHVAHQRIAIDLDDGVKVNYQKFQGVEVPQGDGKKDLKQDLLFKVKM